jgi:multidrug efflux pump subunit AcrA (membrane-fusion protein)
MRLVTLGARSGADVEVLSGLTAGEKVEVAQ